MQKTKTKYVYQLKNGAPLKMGDFELPIFYLLAVEIGSYRTFIPENPFRDNKSTFNWPESNLLAWIQEKTVLLYSFQRIFDTRYILDPFFRKISSIEWKKIVVMATYGPLIHGTIWKPWRFSITCWKDLPGVAWGFLTKNSKV